MDGFREELGGLRVDLRSEFPDADPVSIAAAADIATMDDPLTAARRLLEEWQDGLAPIFARSDPRVVKAGQRQAEPEVVALREELFGASDPPLPEEEAARGWLAGAWEHVASVGGDSEAMDRVRDALHDLHEQGEPYSLRPALQRVWTWEAFEDEELERRTGRPGWYAPTTVRPGNPYHTLGRSVQVMTESLGGYPVDWTLHVLTGREVSIPAVQVRVLHGLHGLRSSPVPDLPTTVSGEWEIPAHLQVRMNRPLTHRELRELYKSVSEVWAGEGLMCETCGEGFEAERNDAKYCSNACRQKAYRRRKVG